MQIASMVSSVKFNGETNLNTFNMLRWTFVGVIFFITPGQSFEHHETQMQRTIENERQTIRIRNTILKELKNIGAKIFPFDDGVVTASHKSSGIPQSNIAAVQAVLPAVISDVHTAPKPDTIVSIGEPMSASRKNKCMVFRIGKVLKDVQQMHPFKLHLWVHIRKLKSTDGKTTKAKMKLKRAADDKTHEITKTAPKGDRKKNKDSKQNKKDRQIMIFVSDGSKILVKMRMLVQETNWYKIDLPISQLPEVIRENDTLQLCFKCKRCNKKVKLDLYSKPTMRSEKNKVKIPFIHIETENYLPQKNYRHKRDDDTHNKIRNDLDLKIASHSCCKEIVYTETMSSLSPSILYPSSVNISYCGTISKNASWSSLKTLLSVKREKSNDGDGHCFPREYKSLSLLILDRSQNIKDTIIRDLIPTGCICRASN